MNFSGFNAVLKAHLSDLERVIREIAKYLFYNYMAFLKSILPKITEKRRRIIMRLVVIILSSIRKFRVRINSHKPVLNSH